MAIVCLSFVMGKKPSPSPIASAPVPDAAPPVTNTAPEVMQAGQDLRQQTMLKKSIKRTIFAGDTGGFNPGAKVNPAGGNPLVPPQGKL